MSISLRSMTRDHRPPSVTKKHLCIAACTLLLVSITYANHVPDWAKDIVWYQVFPERFANGDSSNDPTRESLSDPQKVPYSWSVMNWDADWQQRAIWEERLSPYFHDTLQHRRYGGDLQGVIDKLDTLKALGVNGIYFNPVFYADSLHKYDGNSFHHIDPHFGPDPEGDLALILTESSSPRSWQWTAADKLFLHLLQEAKRRGMRIIIDGVWNHTGRDFFAFSDIRSKHQKSRYARWYDVTHFDDPRTAHNEFNYHGWSGFKSLPEFANDPSGQTLAPGPKHYIFHASKRWMDPNGDGDPSDGIDGWRLDVAEEVPNGFWEEWHAYIRSINPEVFTSAEIWGSSADFLKQTHFSSAMNYRGFAIPIKGWLIDGKISVSEFSRRLDTERNSHTPDTKFTLQNLIDSHDTQRVASAIANRHSFTEYKNADWFDYDDGERVNTRTRGYNNASPDETGRRIWKMVALFQATYVGSPMIYYGTENGMWGADDPEDRKPTNWNQIDTEIHQSYQQALALRHRFVSLRRGAYRVLETRDDSQIFAFERTHRDERVVIVFNRGNGDAYLNVDYLKGLELIYATDVKATTKHLPQHSGAAFAKPIY
ncbi:glycoside hydrolase family 13 protein [Opitutales bacterium]|nr:glycoside hydrolase family 13 protein [Opitutales bacterium]MDB2357644.1 glycoside hydrolase family 13 protein [Opitutales bacterium]